MGALDGGLPRLPLPGLAGRAVAGPVEDLLFAVLGGAVVGAGRNPEGAHDGTREPTRAVVPQ